MRTVQRAVFVSVVAAAIAALSVPIMGLRASATGSTTTSKAPVATAKAAVAEAAVSASVQEERRGVRSANGQEALIPTSAQDGSAGKAVSAETMNALGIKRVANPVLASKKMEKLLRSGKKGGGGSGDVSIQSGQPNILNSASALSAALMTTIGGRDNQFSEVDVDRGLGRARGLRGGPGTEG